MRAWHRGAVCSAPVPIFRHSSVTPILRFQAEILVLFPHSDWTIMPQMINFVVALTQIVDKIDFKSDIGSSRDEVLWFFAAVLKGDAVKRGSNPKS
jgi:hypothetical protein